MRTKITQAQRVDEWLKRKKDVFGVPPPHHHHVAMGDVGCMAKREREEKNSQRDDGKKIALKTVWRIENCTVEVLERRKRKRRNVKRSSSDVG